MDGHVEPEFNPIMEPEEAVRPFDVHESSERAGLLKLLAAAGVLLALAFIVLKLYQPGTRARTDPPLITADNTPFKVVPEDVGGAQTPDQDKEVFEVMGGATPSTDVVTLPAPEVPVSLPRQAAAAATSEPEGATPEPSTQVAAAPAPRQQAPVEPKPRVIQQPPPTIMRPDPTPKTPVPSTPSPRSSQWVVQVASLRSESEATATFDRIKSAHSAILGPYRPDIRRVDLAEKGVYYRARVDGFGAKSEAEAACLRLKAAGQACFVTKR